MRLKLVLILLIISVSYCSLFASTPQDRRRGSDESVEISTPGGVVYSLPRNGFIVELCAVQSIYVPGPYARYAKKYLGIDKVIENEKTQWQIQSIELEKTYEPDPDAMFIAMDTIEGNVSLLPDGIIAGLNSEVPQSAQNFFQSSFLNENIKPKNVFADRSADDFYFIQLDSETGVETEVEKNIEEKAREAADYIIRLRKKRAYTILNPSDVVPEDGDGYEVFIDEAHRLDKVYTELFTGKVIEKTHKFQYVFVPGNSNVRNEVLFRFSEENGIMGKSNIAGRPIFISFTKQQELVDNSKLLLSENNIDIDKGGLYYRIPVMADIEITDGVNSIYQGKTTVAQFGVAMPVPPHFLNGNYSITYNVETGSIKSILPVK